MVGAMAAQLVDRTAGLTAVPKAAWTADKRVDPTVDLWVGLTVGTLAAQIVGQMAG